jgi:hypothetical protein
MLISHCDIIEPGQLEELSRRVEAAEREFAAQDLDQKLTDLESAKQRQVGFSTAPTIVIENACTLSHKNKQVYLLNYYEREIARIKLDMASIKEIRAELPDTCWNKIRLEP